MRGNRSLVLTEGGEPWKASLSALYRDLQRYDMERSLLQAIDAVIVEKQSESPKVIEGAFSDAAAYLTDMFRLAKPGRCYVYTGKELVGLKHEGVEVSPARLPVTAAVAQLAGANNEKALLLAANGQDALFEDCGDIGTILLQPIRPRGSPLLAILLFADTDPPEVAVIDQPEFRNTAAGVARQLRIAFEHWSDSNGATETQRLWDIMMSERLGARDSFKLLAQHVPRFLPRFGPLAIPEPEVQILMLDDSDSVADPYLTIRGSTGEGREDEKNEKIHIGRSISGLLIERSPDELPYFCDDPRRKEWGSRYKSYLGVGKDKVIRTELAVRLEEHNAAPEEDGPTTTGVVNLESDLEDAFTIHHIFAMRLLAGRIAPMAGLFEGRMRSNTVMHMAVMSNTASFLEALADAFDHAVKTRLTGLRVDSDNLRELVAAQPEIVAALPPEKARRSERLVKQLDNAVSRLESNRSYLSTTVDSFTADISDLGKVGDTNLLALMEETADLARRAHLKKSDNIRIEVGGPHGAHVYAGRILKQHVYSLLTNAVYALRERVESDPATPGRVAIDIARPGAPGKAQERELNKRWLVTIRDNGVGVSPEDLSTLRQFDPGTHLRRTEPGQGYGMSAVHRYIESINGMMSIDSELGVFFEVKLFLDEFNPNIHQSTSTGAR